MDVTVRTLSEFALFANLDTEILQQIASHVREHVYETNQIISLASEPCHGAHVIVQGIVSVRRLSIAGREYVMDYLGPGEWFNIVPVLDGGHNLDTMEAVSHVVSYLIPSHPFLQIVQEHETIATALLEQLASRIRYLSDTVEDLALYTVRTRLARFLLTTAEESLPGSRRWTQEEIAAHIGTVRDVIGRTLRNFAREGLIQREQGRLMITDHAGLEREAMQE